MWRVILLYFTFAAAQYAKSPDEEEAHHLHTWVDNIMKWQAGQNAGAMGNRVFPT